MEDFYLTREKASFTLLTVLYLRGRVGWRRGGALVMMCKTQVGGGGEQDKELKWRDESNELYTT